MRRPMPMLLVPLLLEPLLPEPLLLEPLLLEPLFLEALRMRKYARRGSKGHWIRNPKCVSIDGSIYRSI